jgi:hypothetical protein
MLSLGFQSYIKGSSLREKLVYYIPVISRNGPIEITTISTQTSNKGYNDVVD